MRAALHGFRGSLPRFALDGFVGALEAPSTLPITVRATDLKNATATSVSPTFTVPATTQTGDLIVATLIGTLEAVGYVPPTAPAGWTMVRPIANRGSTTTGLIVSYCKIAAGIPGQTSTDASTTVTLAGHANRAYQVFQTVTTGATRPPRARAAWSSAGTYAFAPRMTNVAAGALVYCLSRTAATNVPTVTGGTQLATGASSGTGATSTVVQQAAQAAAGSTGAMKYAFTSAAYEIMTVVID